MKLKTTHALALCALTMLAAQPVWAATVGPDTELKVTGKITPGSCTVRLTGEAKYADAISADSIHNVAEGTDLGDTPPVPLTIDCGDKPTQVGISLTDNMWESRVDGLKVNNFTSNKSMFGLGMSNGHKLGAYSVWIQKFNVDGEDSKGGLIKEGESIVTSVTTGHNLWADEWSDRKQLITWVAAGTSIPVTGRIFTSQLFARAAINKSSELDLTNDVELGGSAKLTVYYL